MLHPLRLLSLFVAPVNPPFYAFAHLSMPPPPSFALPFAAPHCPPASYDTVAAYAYQRRLPDTRSQA